MEYPSNSKRKQAEESRKKQDKVISGKLVKTSNSKVDRIAESFLGDTIGNSARYLLEDVIIPSIKNSLADIVCDGIETILFGEALSHGHRRSRGRSGGSLGRLSYNSIYDDDRRSRRRDDVTYSRRRKEVRDIILESRGDAEEVLDNLVTILEECGEVSVAELYDLVGEGSTFTDCKIGWTSLSQASVKRVRTGYLVDLPNPKQL